MVKEACLVIVLKIKIYAWTDGEDIIMIPALAGIVRIFRG